MATTRDLLNRRKAVTNTRQITRTMEMVSTAKLQKAQTVAKESRPYARTLRQIIGNLAATGARFNHPLLREHQDPRRAVVIVMTSDRGLCGGYNNNILREAMALLQDLRQKEREIELFVLGKKAVGTLSFRGERIKRKWTGISDKPQFQYAEEIAGELIRRYEAEEVDEVYLCYSEFVSQVQQQPRTDLVLPASAIAEKVQGEASQAPQEEAAEYLFHPAPQLILNAMLPLVVKSTVFQAMLQNAAGEQAARRVAMHNATEAADEMITQITRRYNRARQERITTEILEIVGGANAQS